MENDDEDDDEDETMTMTQPDLISKLRELIAKGKVGWMDSTDFSHELGYALGGNKVYPDAEDCTKAHPCIAIPDAAYPCTAKRVIVFDADELESLLGREATPEKVEVCGVCGDFLAGDYCATCDAIRVRKQPSTPIVPGTAGLSAEQLQAADGLNAVLGAATPAERWTCPDCGYDSMPYPPKDYHICPKCMVEFGNDDRKSTLIEREARIRKFVLEEAAALAENWANVVPNHDRDYPKRFGNAIRALAERPAPAGEVKGASE